MPLSPGTRLGGYDIVSKLGEGGMGEVYRARDPRLGRDVALKILPEAFASDPDRLMRFEREARTLAALNHPNIAQVHGLEESPSAGSGQAGTLALVMELVAGEDLSTRIARGPIPLDEALPIARQIAEALEAAHEAGIIHRDLKPANIKVRDDGTVKVLDFGLAKALESAPDALGDGATITSPAVTMRGVILGTAAYMAPEQAKGKPVDRRADIWAFGCVLYEMLTGARAFKGDDITDTITAVLRDEPDWNALPATLPPGVRLVLHGCFAKDPRRRLRDAGDVPLLLDGSPSTSLPASRHQPYAAARRLVLAAVLVAAGLGIGALAVRSRAPEPTGRLTVLGLRLPPNANLTEMAVTPGGTHVVFVAGSTRLMVRPLDSLAPVEIASGANLSQPFISPDGQWVGFVDESSHLLKVPIGGGPAIDLAFVTGRVFGATWLNDDTIVVATAATDGLLRVAAAGGQPVATVTTPAPGTDHVLPQRLPDGRRVLFTIRRLGSSEMSAEQLAVADVTTGTVTTIFQSGGPARLVPGGRVAYLSQGRLFLLPFDAAEGTVPAGAAPTDSGIRATAFDVTSDGTLIYGSADAGLNTSRRALAWVDRTGRETVIPGEPRSYQYPAISPDGSQAVIAALSDGGDLWRLDIATSSMSRLTFGTATETAPVWTPDGRQIVYSSNRVDGVFNLWRQAADGTGEPERLTTSAAPQFSTGVTPDGRHVIYWEAGLGNRDLFMVALDGSGRVTPLVPTPSGELMGAVSPDGRWLAYESNASGRRNIVIQPFPQTSGGRWEVTTDEGRQPAWSRDGTDLFFFAAGGALSRVRLLEASPALRLGAIESLLPPRYYGALAAALVARTYDVTPDGRRFLVIKAVDEESAEQAPDLVVVQHWASHLGSGATPPR